MHIGVDATFWRNRRVFGRHVRGLFKALVSGRNDYKYTFFFDSPEMPWDLPPGVLARTIPFRAKHGNAPDAGERRSIFDVLRFAGALSDPSLDVIIFPSLFSYVPTLGRARKIVFHHDVIMETHPTFMLQRPLDRFLWRAKARLAIGSADAVVTVSGYSRDAIAKHYGLSVEKIRVVGEAPDDAFRPVSRDARDEALKRLGIDATARFIVYVGGFDPHKNVDALISAFERIAGTPGFEDALLVMVGEVENATFRAEAAKARRRAAASPYAERMVFTGYLPDDALAALLGAAYVLVLPSLMEGFGLPAIEAAACGCPVIATKESPLPEILKGGGVFIDPTSDDELEEALIRLLSSRGVRDEMAGTAREAIKKLSWDLAAGEFQRIIEALCKK
jgi:glycosyltransferase involved in cell wall biosynthesis